jgi:hypothetical protein
VGPARVFNRSCFSQFFIALVSVGFSLPLGFSQNFIFCFIALVSYFSRSGNSGVSAARRGCVPILEAGLLLSSRGAGARGGDNGKGIRSTSSCLCFFPFSSSSSSSSSCASCRRGSI